MRKTLIAALLAVGMLAGCGKSEESENKRFKQLEVSELKKDLLDKQKKYTEKLFECRKKAHRSEVYYRNKINKIQDILEKL
nr:MAG TPA: lipoprotein [Caudoviricetes sp.]